ncbi:hypothetical protein BIY40_05120 [Pediococcus acidilactici]|nr:hypothetical protein BIY40_05120 [Pediococcus acidilactici]
MARKDYSQLAKDIVALVGGKENIENLIHCITRLRFYLKDESLAQTAKIKALNGVIDVQKHQINTKLLLEIKLLQFTTKSLN